MAAIRNKKAHFDYEILDTIEAGIVLAGYEVKSLRAGHGKLEGARVLVRGGEAFLVGATIPAFQAANAPKEYDPSRPRKLLLHQKEIADIAAAEGQKGLTVVPISMYNRGRNLKVEIGIARGKKKADKRETIKKRDTARDLERSLKDR
ncbi:MAG TPA: SsrA-binding protein SmpB [Candidatus Paceibacterota bacterium]|nr:SsrA-binding protein SmpB [Candidatus Paceibacterota bacterium]